MKKHLSVALAMVLGSSLAMASSNETHRLDRRQARQNQRIEQGEASGSLTTRETNRLEHGQDHIQTLEDKAKADGTVTSAERARLESASDRQSHRIYRQKHDSQTDLDHNGRVDRPRAQ